MQATINDLDFNFARQLAAKENPVTDEQLLINYRETGDREAFAQLVYRYERELFNYLRRYLGNTEMAEDAFQATFLQVHLKCDQFQSDRRLRPWLYTIATNQAIDARRRTKRHRMVSLDAHAEHDVFEETGRVADLLESSERDPMDDCVDIERRELVRQTLDQLPESMYSVIHLVYFQGMKYREAAEVLDLPVGTVKSRIHAAIARLGEVWKTNQVD
ncbi:MAG TPA: sigma-70 family RNA polymerase sigma factor [Pirellulaceae bacterium]|nr:sigma-70 family RNA polymerase sigma factor [Pirellulaceae bacterium]